MPEVPSTATAPPAQKRRRESAAQNEIQAALELLKSGKGKMEKDEKEREFMVVELDAAPFGGKDRKAYAALMNLRWKWNPENPQTNNGDPSKSPYKDEYEKYFKSVGRGGLNVYGSKDGKHIYVSAKPEYAGKVSSTPKPAAKTKATTAKKSTASKPANGNGKSKATAKK